MRLAIREATRAAEHGDVHAADGEVVAGAGAAELLLHVAELRVAGQQRAEAVLDQEVDRDVRPFAAQRGSDDGERPCSIHRSPCSA